MPNNPAFTELLEDMARLHERKNHDYAKDANPFSNFEEAAAEAGVDVMTVFNVLVGIKNARIRELVSSGKQAENESLLDSYLDRVMYQALQLSYLRSRPQSTEEQFPLSYGHGV